MKSELIEFLLQLAKDPERQQAFRDNYDVAVRAQPISAELKRTLLTMESQGEPWRTVKNTGSDTGNLRINVMNFQNLSSQNHHQNIHTPEHHDSHDSHGNHDNHGGEIIPPVSPQSQSAPVRGNSLVLAGTGIKAVGHLTQETIFWLERADKVLFSVSDEIISSYIQELQPRAESLNRFYSESRPRIDTYRLMARRILECVSEYETVCVVFYGHPRVLVDPVALAATAAAEQGHRVTVLPGVSALDCLFADLGVDIAHNGLQSFEASDFVLRPRPFDPYTPLVLWQAAALGDTSWNPRQGAPQTHVPVLAAILAERYGAEHEIMVYEAQVLPFDDFSLRKGTVYDLSAGILTDGALLYIPAKKGAPVDPDMQARLIPENSGDSDG